jgi:hypothetical protein
MISDSTLRSPYEIRVNLVQETLRAYSPLDLDEAAARELAVRVLYALNSIPEKIRSVAKHRRLSLDSPQRGPSAVEAAPLRQRVRPLSG